MSSDTSVDRYSTVADFELLVGDRRLPVAQVAPEFLVFDSPTKLPPGPATLVIHVDGEEIRRSIELLDAADSPSTRIPIRR